MNDRNRLAAFRQSVGYVSHPLEIEAGDVQIYGVGCYSDTGKLQSIAINDRELTPGTVLRALAMICPEFAADWADDLDEDLLGELIGKAAQDALDAWADYQRGMED